ncbi:hypothetical protein FGO68_gene6933 [Halteria grandinella]|uniref:Uncharacterized protein n=1 Tax=Halteria grandinella TaxID=5974 RepID=A0A8J8STV7_HALGN|nr:hypothetical protein FGO68_gene6933 [Halteria grandinella]
MARVYIRNNRLRDVGSSSDSNISYMLFQTSQEITPDPDSSNGGMIQAPFINLVDTRATIDGTGDILEVFNEVINIKCFHWSDFPMSLEGTGCVASGVCVDTPLKTLQKKFSTVLSRLGRERNFTVDLIYDLKDPPVPSMVTGGSQE